MINLHETCVSTYYEAWRVCEEIFSVACRELFDCELNHLYTREYREKALDVCKTSASPLYVKDGHDCHGHDHYNIVVPEDIIKRMMEEAVYEDGILKIGDIRRHLR